MMTNITKYSLSNRVVQRGLVAGALIAALATSAATAQSPVKYASQGDWVFGTCTSYISSIEFMAALSGRPFNLEDYESHPFETVIPNGGTLNGITYEFPTEFFDGLVGNRYRQNGLQALYYDRNLNGMQDDTDFFFPVSDMVQVTFAAPVLAVGMRFNVGESDDFENYVVLETPSGSAFSGGSAARRDPGSESVLFFVGIICPKPFDTATFYCDANAPTGYNLDDLFWVPAGEVCDAPCDTNCDKMINAFDIEPFLTLLFDPDSDPCCGERGDIGGTGDTNGDGLINSFDIEGFLNCLFP